MHTLKNVEKGSFPKSCKWFISYVRITDSNGQVDQPGRSLRSQRRSREFKSRLVHHYLSLPTAFPEYKNILIEIIRDVYFIIRKDCPK